MFLSIIYNTRYRPNVLGDLNIYEITNKFNNSNLKILVLKVLILVRVRMKLSCSHFPISSQLPIKTLQ